MRRRDFLQSLGLGAGATLLSPLLTRLVSEARGEASVEPLNLMVFTDGNGWGHQGLGRNSVLLDPPRKNSPTDWDLPEVLSAFEPFQDKVTICRRFQNNHGNNLHGNGWGTLSAANPIGSKPGGVSIDRLVALEKGREDAFPSIALGVSTRPNSPAPSTSADGPLRPYPAIGSPLLAHQTLFGGGVGGDAQVALAQDRSLLDGMISDINRARGSLASAERAKLEQLLTSYRTMEHQLIKRQEIFAEREPPRSPPEGATGGMNQDTIDHHVNVISHAFGFGLTHVAHLSVLGFDAHNAGWGFLGFGGDAHEQVAHVGNGYDRDRATSCYRTTIDFKAKKLAALYRHLEQIQLGDSNLAERTLFVWVNSGGGKHHEGSAFHPVVLIGDAGGFLQAGQFVEFSERRKIADAFLTVAQAMGVETDTFGDPEDRATPVSEIMT